MKEMPKIPGLQLRGRTYFIRVRIPQDLLNRYGKKEVIRSLETRDYKVACERIHKHRAIIQSEFDEHRLQMKAAANDPDMLSSFTGAQLEELTLRWMAHAEKRSQDKMAKTEGKRADPESKQEILETLEEDVRQTLSQTQGVEDGGVHYGMNSAAKYLRERGITFNPNSKAFKALGDLFSKSTYAMAQHSLQQWKGMPYAPANPLFARFINGEAAMSAVGQGIKKKVTVKQLFAEYLNDPSRVLSPSTIKNYQIIFRALEEHLGSERYVYEITVEDAEELRDLLLRSPANAKKLAPRKTLKEAADLAAVHGWEIMDRATVNSHLSKFKAVMRFALRKKYIVENPATDLLVQDKEKKKDKRMPFNTEQLQAIFDAPLYVGCMNDERGYNKAGSNRPRRARFWIPLIALYTGLRLNEICQLEVTDTQIHDGIDVILVREESDDPESKKGLKTAASDRLMPVHPVLKNIGLMNYIADVRKAGQKRIFYELKLGDLGYYSADFSKWFGRFLKNVGIKNKKLTFHSFRHNFRDALRKAEITADFVSLLGGWTDDSVSGNYGGGTSSVSVTAEDLYKQIEKVQYKGLNLKHLYGK